MTEKDLPVGNRLMDRAWYRDSDDVIHSGESLVLACLFHVKKRPKRGVDDEDELKEVLGLDKNNGRKRSKTPKNHRPKNK